MYFLICTDIITERSFLCNGFLKKYELYLTYIKQNARLFLKAQLPALRGSNAPEKRSADISPCFILCAREFVDISAPAVVKSKRRKKEAKGRKNKMEKTVGLIFADEMEYAPFLSWVKERDYKEEKRYGNDSVETVLSEGEKKLRLIAVKCGIGKSNAAAATAYLIGEGKADYILNAGLSGAVSRLKREDMIAATSHVECDFDLTAIGYGPGVKADGQRYIYEADEKLLSYALQSEGIIAAPTGTGDIFLTDKVKKDYYRDSFGIEAFDMETAAIASVCDKAEVPFLSLRKISDDADDSSVEDYREMNNRKESCLTELLLNILGRLIADM